MLVTDDDSALVTDGSFSRMTLCHILKVSNSVFQLLSFYHMIKLAVL